MKITNFLILNSSGDNVPSDAHGNNLAFLCSNCGYPILSVAVKNQRGFDEEHPAICKDCGKAFFLDIRENSEKIYIHEL